MKIKKEVTKTSPAIFYVSTPSGNSDKERFESLKAQYIKMLERQKEELRESDQIVEAACG
jgi:hypothetical protein